MIATPCARVAQSFQGRDRRNYTSLVEFRLRFAPTLCGRRDRNNSYCAPEGIVQFNWNITINQLEHLLNEIEHRFNSN